MKAHIGILGNEAADILAKNAEEGVPPDDHEKWVTGGGIRQWTKQRKRRYLEGDGSEDALIGRAMGWRRKAVTNYCRLRGGKGICIGRWWDDKIEEEQTLDHIVAVFRIEVTQKNGARSNLNTPKKKRAYHMHRALVVDTLPTVLGTRP